MLKVALCVAMVGLSFAQTAWNSSETLRSVESSSTGATANQPGNVTFHDFTYVNFDENPETIDQQNFKTLPSSIPSGSGKIIFQNDEEDFLNLLEKSFATFEEDLLSGCVEESDIEKLLQVERDEFNGKLLRFFFLALILFFVSTSISIYAVVQGRRSVLGRNISRKAIFRYKKSFVNESETTQSEQGANIENNSIKFDETSLNSNSLRCRNSNTQYAVSV